VPIWSEIVTFRSGVGASIFVFAQWEPAPVL